MFRFIQATYGITIDAASAKDLGQALRDGVDDGIFDMPNGLNGKVKLAMPKPPAQAPPPPKAEPVRDAKGVLKTKATVYRQVEVVIPAYKSKALGANNLKTTPRKPQAFPLDVGKENIATPKLVLKKGTVHKLAQQSPLRLLSPNVVRALPKVKKVDPKNAGALPPQPAKPLLVVPKHGAAGKSPARLKAKKPAMKRVTKVVKEQTVSIIRRRGAPKAAPPALAPGMLVCGRDKENWKLHRKLGAGGFGDVWMAVGYDESNLGVQVAVKVEDLKCDLPLLDIEAKVFEEMSNEPNFPQKKFLFDHGAYRFLGMEMLGQSAESLRWKHDPQTGKLPIAQVLNFGICALRRLEELHGKGWVHRDIKPDNFITGDAARSKDWFLIDFGFCKRYLDPQTSRHIPQRNGKGCLALAYCMIYLAKGRLPWQGINKDADIWEETRTIKETTPVVELCQWLPSIFADFLLYCQCLDYEQKPEYKRWRDTFRTSWSQHANPPKYAWAIAPAAPAPAPVVRDRTCDCPECNRKVIVV
ncbi:Casein kinase I isoform alpha-like [Tulasnella sp. 417]|nr:Casein kinase I isoform alpha-like [Tulasnella sp. 417]